MLRKCNKFFRRHVQKISNIVFGLALAAWVVSLWFDFVQEFLFKNNVLMLILIGLVVQVLALLDESKSTPDFQTAVHRDQDADLDWLRAYVRERRPGCADLIEYSSFMVNSLLEDLVRRDATIRLLICDPDHAINAWQTRRIDTCIANLRDVTFKDYDRVEVRCYQVPASVRGRKIDEYLNVGWYFYGHDLYGVQGTATMMTVPVNSTEGRLLQTLFDETFELLWEHPTTRKLDLKSAEQAAQGIDAGKPALERPSNG